MYQPHQDHTKRIMSSLGGAGNPSDRTFGSGSGSASGGSPDDDLIGEVNKEIAKKNKILITTLTKRMAEDLTDYMRELGFRVRYLHSDIDTLERTEIVRDMRLDVFDVLVGINLLREGLIFRKLL